MKIFALLFEALMCNSERRHKEGVDDDRRASVVLHHFLLSHRTQHSTSSAQIKRKLVSVQKWESAARRHHHCESDDCIKTTQLTDSPRNIAFYRVGGFFCFGFRLLCLVMKFVFRWRKSRCCHELNTESDSWSSMMLFSSLKNTTTVEKIKEILVVGPN